MVRTMKKDDFGTSVLKSMIPGDAVLVLCDNSMQMNSVRSSVSQHNRLRVDQMKEQGVAKFTAERRDVYNIAVTAEPGYAIAQ